MQGPTTKHRQHKSNLFFDLFRQYSYPLPASSSPPICQPQGANVQCGLWHSIPLSASSRSSRDRVPKFTWQWSGSLQSALFFSFAQALSNTVEIYISYQREGRNGIVGNAGEKKSPTLPIQFGSTKPVCTMFGSVSIKSNLQPVASLLSYDLNCILKECTDASCKRKDVFRLSLFVGQGTLVNRKAERKMHFKSNRRFIVCAGSELKRSTCQEQRTGFMLWRLCCTKGCKDVNYIFVWIKWQKTLPLPSLHCCTTTLELSCCII